MYGAILGDVVGSRFEFNNIKTKEFELFTNDYRFTDDTVMIISVIKSLLDYKKIIQHLFQLMLYQVCKALGDNIKMLALAYVL